jgi:cytochrome P450
VRKSTPNGWAQNRRMHTNIAHKFLPCNLLIGRRFKLALEHLDAIIYGIISERRRSGKDTGDLLSLFLKAYDTEDDGGSMNDQQLRDESVTLFFAGHETVANALTWTWYLLSQNPQVESKLLEELHDKLSGRAPTSDDVKNLAYTTNVLTESMRLYPPAYAIGREATQDYPILGTSYVASKGATVAVSQYILHRDPRFFSEPGRFDPDRWTAEMRSKLPRFAYFPFGAGPRSCIGEPFAWMEGVLLLSTIAQKWQMRHVTSHKVALMPRIALGTCSPSSPIRTASRF